MNIALASLEEYRRSSGIPSTFKSAVDTTLEYRFRWTAPEHRQFYRSLRREAARTKASGRTVPLVVLAFGAYVVWDAWRSGRGWAQLALVFGLWLLLFVALLAAMRAITPFLSARSYQRTHKCIADDQVRVFTLEGIEARCTESTVTVRWSAVRRAVETPEFFLFFTTPRCAIHLPKRSVADAEVLRRKMRECLGDRAELMPARRAG